MKNFEQKGEHEAREGREAHWEHSCKSCNFEGSTTFTARGNKEQMDVYSCSDHDQPGLYGSEGKKFEGDNIVVRYGETTRDSIGEISFSRNSVDIETLRAAAKNRRGDDYPPAQIAIGKIL